MRKALVNELCLRAEEKSFVFLTGDLGFNALEPLRDILGERFINAGIAEQNMVSVAAGLARNGHRPWVYSIAPFLYARAFEQIRNDVCQADKPVIMVGGGGGYSYGVMGPSHHAIDDYGSLQTLPNIRCYVPAFKQDMSELVPTLMKVTHPAYLRLANSEEPEGYEAPEYQPWRTLFYGRPLQPHVIVIGSIVGTYIKPLHGLCSLWTVGELPATKLPAPILHTEQTIIVVEEHVEHGSFGQWLKSQHPNGHRIKHFFAKGYPSGTYGSKEFHRKESGLDAASIVKELR